MRAAVAILTIALGLPLAACGPSLLRGPHIAKDAEIADKPDHRELVGMVERYRLAMEARNPRELLSMASPNYFERAGTTAGDDDYGFERLEKILSDRFKRLKALRLHILVDAVKMQGKDRAIVDYSYSGRFLIQGKKRDQWAHKSWESRFRFERHNGRWMFLSGL